uniref:Transmembrane protein 59 like n=1 Tax=Bubo bubo TaxID=30461 RepID=A0A8C0EYZ6_BUBBB
MGTRPRAHPTIGCEWGGGGVKATLPPPGDAIAPDLGSQSLDLGSQPWLWSCSGAQCPPTGCRGAVGGVRPSHGAELGASFALSSSSSPQDAVLNACYRGCRLFSICHFVDASAELNTTRAQCEAACAEAYSNAEEQFGCVTGCRKQLPEVESRKEKLKAPSFSMFDLVSTFCNDIVSSAQSFISSTWTFYLQADDGKVVVFQVGVSHVPSLLSAERGGTPLLTTFSLFPCHPASPSLRWIRTWTRSKELPGSSVPPRSRRSGLPRWILAACLFLSIMVMLWLSCASLVTAPEQHVKTQPLSINGDKEYLEDLDGPGTFPLPPVIAVTLCPAHGGEDAGPLPLKVDLDKTVL